MHNNEQRRTGNDSDTDERPRGRRQGPSTTMKSAPADCASDCDNIIAPSDVGQDVDVKEELDDGLNESRFEEDADEGPDGQAGGESVVARQLQLQKRVVRVHRK